MPKKPVLGVTLSDTSELKPRIDLTVTVVLTELPAKPRRDNEEGLAEIPKSGGAAGVKNPKMESWEKKRMRRIMETVTAITATALFGKASAILRNQEATHC